MESLGALDDSQNEEAVDADLDEETLPQAIFPSSSPVSPPAVVVVLSNATSSELADTGISFVITPADTAAASLEVAAWLSFDPSTTCGADECTPGWTFEVVVDTVGRAGV